MKLLSFFKNLKIKNKLLFLTIFIMFCMLIPVLMLSHLSIMDMAKKEALGIAKDNYKIFDLYLEIQKNELIKSNSLITLRNVPKKAIENKNFDIIQTESIPRAINKNTDIFIILDENKKIIADKNNASLRGHDFSSFEAPLKKAEESNQFITGYDILKKQDLLNQSESLFEKIKIIRKPTKGAKKNFINKTVEEDALVHFCVSPINSFENNKKIIGYVISGTILNNNFSIVDKIKGENEELAFTIFKDDLRISTTVKNKEGKRAVGTLLSEKVVNAVLEEGKVYEGEAMVVGSPYLSFYSPIVDTSGKVIGIIFSAVSKNSISSKFTNLLWSIVFIAFIFLFLFIIPFTLHIVKLIINPIQEVKDSLKEIAMGNLLISEVKNDSKDEVGELVQALNLTIKNIKELISSVLKSVEEMSAASEQMLATAEQTAQGSQQTANSTAQLAQGTQEISSNVEQGVSTIDKMNKVIQSISLEAIDVAKLGDASETNANEGSKHVQNAVGKIDNIKNVAGDISLTVAKLGTLSSEIETIVDLIKGIAAQTNLLALNAAIEAARAGEHGKGFAVVAEEVKKLATQSAEATDKVTAMIKEIQSETRVAVNKVNKATTEVEEGVTVVNNAGKALENIIDQVKKANGKIQGIKKQIEGVANNSDDVVKMVENISAVTDQTLYSAEEISSITEEQAASMEEITANSQCLAKIAENLQKQISIFKI